MSWRAFNVHYELKMSYQLVGIEKRALIVVLHGYQDHASSMLRRLGWNDLANLPFGVLAVNGPFPVPHWTSQGYVEAYSWYFRDSARGVEYVSPSSTAMRISELLDQVDSVGQQKILLGFSQGGYLAPYIAALRSDVRAIIGLGCGYNESAYEAVAVDVAIAALHAPDDEVVPFVKSKQEIERLRARGFDARMLVMPEVGHHVHPSFDPIIRKLVNEVIA